MGDTLNETYKEILDTLHKMSSTLCNELGIEIDINILKEDRLNASVQHIEDNKYSINIYSSCLNLGNRIEDITERYTEDDWKFFHRVHDLNIFERFEEDTYREHLNNLFGTVILLHIYLHECSHILARHVEGSGGTYEEYDAALSGNYELQEREMVADWYATKFLYPAIYFGIIQNDEIDAKEILATMRQITVLYWLSLTIEFQIFDSNHRKQVDDFSKLTHPHPAVRLFYNIEAMGECMADILNTYGIDDEEAEKGVKMIIEELDILIRSFLHITKTPIWSKANDFQIMNYYIKLRDIPYTDNAEKNNYVHLMQLPDEYREEFEKYRNLNEQYDTTW